MVSKKKKKFIYIFRKPSESKGRHCVLIIFVSPIKTVPFGDNMLTPYWGSSSLKKKKRTCDPIPFWKHFRAEKLKDQSTDSSSEFADHWVVLNDPKVYKIIKLLSLFSLSYFPLGISFLLLLTAVWGECEKKCSCWGRDWKSLSWNSFSPSSLVAGSHILERSPSYR